MINRIAAALVALGGSLALLFAPQASASDHFGPRVTVDVRQLPKGDCWYEVDRHNVDTICAPAPVKASGDCKLVAYQDRTVCREVKAQRAFGWTDDNGDPQNWIIAGPKLVHEITHSGLSKAEMGDALRGARRDYRAYVTNVTFNVDEIARRCGYHGGDGEVREVRGADGNLYTWKLVTCD